MHEIRSFQILVLAIGALLVSGCEAVGMRPVRLDFPVVDCSGNTSICFPFRTCSELQIKLIYITVGPAHPRTTLIACPSSLVAPAVVTMVDYTPGQGSYEISAKYEKGMTTEVATAGPFSDEDPQTPWRLFLH